MQGGTRRVPWRIVKYCALVILIVLYIIFFFHSCIWSFKKREFQKTNPLAFSEIRMTDEREKARKKAIERIKLELTKGLQMQMIKEQIETRKIQEKIRRKEKMLALLRDELRTLSAGKENSDLSKGWNYGEQ